MCEISTVIKNEIKEANNKYLQELHKGFINNNQLNVQEALILNKFLEYMIKHD